MNMYLAQSEATIAECKYLVSTKANLTSSQDSKPLLVIKQDAMTGGYKLTWGIVKIRKEVFMDVLTTNYFDPKYIQHKFKHIKKVSRSTLPKTTSLLKTSLIEELRELKRSSGDQHKIKQLTNEVKIEIQRLEEEAFQSVVYTGHNLFSFLLPDDFEYTCQNKLSPDEKPVCIKRGVLVSGTLSKDAIGSSSGSLIHHLFKDYGRDIAADFISRYQVLINTWLQHNGFSVGIEDCIPKNTNVITNEVEKCYLEASAFIQIERDPEILEQKIADTLNKAQSIGQKIAKDSLSKTNNLVSMVSSGAKGSYANITQVTGVVGQQNVQAKRIQKTFGGRTIPYFPHTNNPADIPEGADTLDLKVLHNVFASRGFVSSSFYKGLSMQEFIFLAAGGREGLIDTAVKTADTGYVQRRTIKLLEDLKFTYLGSVVNSNNTILDFMYGSDLFDAAELIKTKHGYSYIDIDHVVGKLNTELESGVTSRSIA